MAELSLSALERVIKKAGANRVSVDGKESMRVVLESYAQEIATRAVVLANHAGRKTVKVEDIALAAA